VAPSYQYSGQGALKAAQDAVDVPELDVYVPDQPSEWEADTTKLIQRLESGEGLVFIGLKELASRKPRATRRVVADPVTRERSVSVGTRASLSRAGAIAALQRLDSAGVEVLRYHAAIGVVYARLPKPAIRSTLSLPSVEFVEPADVVIPMGSLVGPAAPPTVPMTAQTTPWGVSLIKAPAAWALSTGSGAKLLQIDTGYDRGHPDLPLIPLGNCFGIEGGCNDLGPYNHGTHVFGIAAAINNSQGVIGVAYGVPAAQIYHWGVCSSVVYGCNVNEAAAALNWSVTGLGSKGVINMSFGSSQPFQVLSTAVAAAWNAGHVLVASAGNDSTYNTMYYPGGLPGVLAVSGLRQNKAFATDETPCNYSGNLPHIGSNWGPYVDVSAPWSALSTIPGGGYGDETLNWCGTSMAAPHVAGSALLVRSYHPTWTNTQVASQLTYSAEGLGTPGYDNYFGYGMVRPDRALGLFPPSVTATLTPGMKPKLTWSSIPLATSYKIYRRVTTTLCPLWNHVATVASLTFTDIETPSTSFYGYQTFPGNPAVAVGYYVTAVGADGFETGLNVFATYIPNGTPICF
jgi:subtilisin